MKNGKKNNFKNLHTIKGDGIKHIDKILWEIDLPKEEKPTIKDILCGIQIIDSQLNSSLNISIDEYLECNVLGYVITDHEYIYLISDSEYKFLYISIGKSHPLFWYKFSTKKSFSKNFDKIYECYTRTLDQYCMHGYTKIFVGDVDLLSVNIHDIENHFLLQKFTDKLIYGSLWQDHPFRNEYETSYIDTNKSIIFTGQAMRQLPHSPYSVSIRTLYSKSLITVYDYDGVFIMEIFYDQIKSNQINNINKLLEANYKLDFPMDVLITIIGFPYITYQEIIKMKPLTRYHIIILGFLATNEEVGQEIAKEFKLLLDKKEEDKFDEIVYQDMESYVKMADDHNLFKKIIEDKEIDDLIDNGDLNNLDDFLDKILAKYNCVDKGLIRNELEEFILMHFEDEDEEYEDEMTNGDDTELELQKVDV